MSVVLLNCQCSVCGVMHECPDHRKEINMIIHVEVIYSFDGLRPSQAVETLEFANPPSEAAFLLFALNALEDVQLKQLRKISACQMNVKSDDEALAWIIPNNGKYFFGAAEFRGTVK
jgi:hypothetical protein